MGPHQGFIYMLLAFKLLKLFRKPVVLLNVCDINVIFIKFIKFTTYMQLYWFRNLVQYFPSWDTPYMKYDATHILTSLKNDVKGTERDI